MGRLIFKNVHWEADVPAYQQIEDTKGLSELLGPGKKWYLHYVEFRTMITDDTIASSTNAFILWNSTDYRAVSPQIGTPSASMVEGRNIITCFQARNNSQRSGFAETGMFVPPQPILFDENDVLGVHMILVNKGAADARFGITVILAISEEKQLD